MKAPKVAFRTRNQTTIREQRIFSDLQVGVSNYRGKEWKVSVRTETIFRKPRPPAPKLGQPTVVECPSGLNDTSSTCLQPGRTFPHDCHNRQLPSDLYARHANKIGMVVLVHVPPREGLMEVLMSEVFWTCACGSRMKAVLPPAWDRERRIRVRQRPSFNSNGTVFRKIAES